MLASVQKIHSIQSHFNPEVNKIELAKVMEWPVVIPKNQFKDGDFVVFIEIDSLVPPENSYFKFLERQKYRVWNAKFKGAQSSGLVCPVSILPDFKEWEKIIFEGMDCTELLKITKFERSIDAVVCGDAIGKFPTNLISISDELNLLSYAKALSELEGKEVYESIKSDGSSVSFIFNNHEFKACSRRLEMKEGSGFPYMLEKKYNIKNKLIELNKNIAIQGEAVGPKLNGNNLGLKELEVRIFRAKNLDTKQILGLYELIDLCKQLKLPMVEIIEIHAFNKSLHNVQYFQNLADSLKWPTNGQIAEGLVLSPTIPFYSEILQKSWSSKIINTNYK